MRKLIEKDAGVVIYTVKHLCRTLDQSAKISVLFSSNRPWPWALVLYVTRQQLVKDEYGEKLDEQRPLLLLFRQTKACYYSIHLFLVGTLDLGHLEHDDYISIARRHCSSHFLSTPLKVSISY